MKTFRNRINRGCSVKFPLFAVGKFIEKNQYDYFIRTSKNIWFKEWIHIYSSKGKKVRFLNRITLPVISILFNAFVVTPLFIAFLLVGVWVYNYFDGCRNFVRNKAWVQNVRYFNWCNIVLLLVFVVLFIIK